MEKKEQEVILALDIDNVTKDYFQWVREGTLKNILINIIKPERKRVRALNSLDFKVKKGEFLAYAGENGSGKSTTIKILSGILYPTTGKVSVLGLNPKKERVKLMRKIGVLFGNRTELWWDHPVINSYRWKKTIWGISDKVFEKNLEVVTELLDLSDILHTFTRELSLGQRLRADIGMLLLHDPEIIFLDEPTLGLDVKAKKRVISFLKKINKEKGTTIVVTSHDMENLEEMAQRIILLSKGNIAFDGSFEELRKKRKSLIMYSFCCFGETLILEGLKLKYSDGYKHEYISEDDNVGEFLEKIREIKGIENIEIKKVPISDVINEIYKEN